jgi:TPP-dependent pyruvate/acetoin dehydrogenase alpha subunit
LGYGCHGVTIDGTDVELVYDTCLDAVKRARKGDGPTIIETITMRMRGHAEHDDFSYVPKSLLEHWQKMDPVDRYIAHCIAKKVLKQSDIEDLRNEIIQSMRDAIDAVIDLPFPPAEEAFKNVFID